MAKGWRYFIDTGGTFTDCLARDADGDVHRVKVLSSGALRGRVERLVGARAFRVDASWAHIDDLVRGFELRLLGADGERRRVVRHDGSAREIHLDEPPPALGGGFVFEVSGGEPAPLLAARVVTGTGAGRAVPSGPMRLATTLGTNALLERRGAAAALFVTEGFGDLLRIGDQQRPDLFALEVALRPSLASRVVEVRERLAADGSVLVAPDLDEVERAAKGLRGQGIRAVAVALLHSFVNPVHERAIAERLRDLGFECTVASSDIAAVIRLLPRAETAVIEAYLGPVIAPYLRSIAGGIAPERLHVLSSAGGLVADADYRASDSLLSGPAGGVAGAAAAGRRAGVERVIGFDMGGTSTDVARFDGDFEYRFEHDVGGVRLIAPALAIETVAAGGGSICGFEDGRLRVGPQSAGADPGPACYGAGGPLTLTDVNLLLGRLDASRFQIPISPDRAESAFESVLAAIERDTDGPADRDEVLEGLLAIADERMADAIAAVSIGRGYDPADHALVAFGGAGSQHACAVADRLGMHTIIMPADASLLSAAGLEHAVVERFAHRQVLARLDAVAAASLPELLETLAGEAAEAVAREGVPRERVRTRRRIVNLRLEGQETALPIEYEASRSLDEAFAERYAELYGYRPSTKPVEIESVRVVASIEAAAPPLGAVVEPTLEAARVRVVRARFGGAWRDAAEYERGDLAPGSWLRGPAIVLDESTAYVIGEGWRAETQDDGALVVRRPAIAGIGRRRNAPEVVEQELFTNRFSSVARLMGQMLQRTACSTNVKERLDYSCGLLDASGELLVNAPHIPVHLGALGKCVRALRGAIEMRAGDVVVTNHPAFGGSHLPDVTVVTPVFSASGRHLGYCANRAHHAELGGTRPGSMPPDSRRLVEEGVVIPPMHLVRGGVERFDEVEAVLRGGAYPARSVGDNLADLRAQAAANVRGDLALRALAGEWGDEEVLMRMDELAARAERLARRALAELPDGAYEATEHLDDGAAIRVKISIDGDGALIDFSGTAPVHRGNLNATPAIVTSAVLYVLRLLIGERLPLNEGILRAVTLHLEPGLLDPPFADDPAACPAVVGGNVETSQRIVDTLLKALGLAACSQGTMNNVLFGTDAFGYYETLGGGTGAGPHFDGADGVHSHMTNTRITDVELLEHRYPVRIERFAIRAGSGGRGRHRGGDGLVREYLFLAPMTLSVLSQHRREGPYGLAGGAAGRPGAQRLIRASGAVDEMAASDGREVEPGDRFRIETPGGGGFGP